jgi:hypothetical protein
VKNFTKTDFRAMPDFELSALVEAQKELGLEPNGHPIFE